MLESAITSFIITMQKVDKNKKLLADELKRLNKVTVNELNQVQYQVDSVIILNENIGKVQRGLAECQHTFEMLVEAFLHAQDGIIQPQLITTVKIRDMMRKEFLPHGLEFPFFSSMEPWNCQDSSLLFSYIFLIIYNTEQDTDTLRAAGNTKQTLDLSAHDNDDDAWDDFQVVESHSSETARSENTSKYFRSFLHKLTSCVPVSSSSPLSVPLFIRIKPKTTERKG